jgi:NAD(P)-dependent dehydrogenase (short-subunit alcohol dehydrogenase family)
MDLNGANAWVVGASSGIGAALAEELLERGARVAISARREDRLHDVSSGRMLVVPADATDAAGLRKAADRVRDELGPLDLVVLNAGYWEQMNVREWDVDVFRRHVEVNLLGMSNGVGAVLPEMIERGAGTIAGVASVAGYRGLPGAEGYGATKAGQINMLEGLRTEVARRGVHVATVCPGFVRTEMTERNRFPMPFMVDADAAARTICDGLEHDRTEIVFPLQMAVLMKLARYLPVRAWTLLWSRRR